MHAAVSYDGLKTIVGCRTIVKKEHGDPDIALNCYPYASLANDKETFIRYMSVDTKDGAKWVNPQATLISLNPNFLDECGMFDDFADGDKYWVTNNESECVCSNDKNILSLNSTEVVPAYGCINFPYATKGSIKLKLSEVSDARLLLSECYLDVSNFLKNSDNKHADIIGKPYVEFPINDGSQEVNVTWDNGNITVTDNKGTITTFIKESISGGFNHMFLISSDGHINVHEFSQHAENNILRTGIEYDI